MINVCVRNYMRCDNIQSDILVCFCFCFFFVFVLYLNVIRIFPRTCVNCVLWTHVSTHFRCLFSNNINNKIDCVGACMNLAVVFHMLQHQLLAVAVEWECNWSRKNKQPDNWIFGLFFNVFFDSKMLPSTAEHSLLSHLLFEQNI